MLNSRSANLVEMASNTLFEALLADTDMLPVERNMIKSMRTQLERLQEEYWDEVRTRY